MTAQTKFGYSFNFGSTANIAGALLHWWGIANSAGTAGIVAALLHWWGSADIANIASTAGIVGAIHSSAGTASTSALRINLNSFRSD